MAKKTGMSMDPKGISIIAKLTGVHLNKDGTIRSKRGTGQFLTITQSRIRDGGRTVADKVKTRFKQAVKSGSINVKKLSEATIETRKNLRSRGASIPNITSPLFEGGDMIKSFLVSKSEDSRSGLISYSIGPGAGVHNSVRASIIGKKTSKTNKGDVAPISRNALFRTVTEGNASLKIPPRPIMKRFLRNHKAEIENELTGMALKAHRKTLRDVGIK